MSFEQAPSSPMIEVPEHLLPEAGSSYREPDPSPVPIERGRIPLTPEQVANLTPKAVETAGKLGGDVEGAREAALAARALVEQGSEER